MEECLITNKICPKSNLKCKKCKLENCREVISMNEKLEKKKDEINLKYIKDNLPEQCKNCSFFIVTNVSQHKVYCPYMVKDRCILK